MNPRRALLRGQGSQRLKNEKQRPDLELKTLEAESIQAAGNKTEDLSGKTKLERNRRPDLPPGKQKTEQHQTKI
jgi:hypothetical protein